MTLSAPFPLRHSADRFGDWPQWRKDMGLGPHRGKDWNRLASRTPIPASGDGVVTWRTNYTDAEAARTELGHRIVIGHPMPDGRTLYLGYSHLDENPTLPVGARVKHRQSVGLLGDTGTASDGDHLHQTASWSNGNPGTVPTIDPMQFLEFTTTAGDGTPITTGDTDMKHIFHPDRGYALVWDEGAYGYPATPEGTAIDEIVAKGIEPSIQYEHAWQWDTEVREANIRGDAMRALQTQHTVAALRAAGLQIDVDEKALAAATAALIKVPPVDVVRLAAELTKAGIVGADPTAIARAVEASLLDNFAAIPGAVNTDAARRLQS